MTKGEKPKPPDNPEQSERFLATAKELEAEETPYVFEKTLGVIAPAKPPPKTGAKKGPTE
jgi:hypothetical protein